MTPTTAQVADFTLFPMNSFLEDAVDKVVKYWKIFRTLPQAEKEKYALPQFETDFADPGYKRKKQEAGDYDNKEFFHHIPFIDGLYEMAGAYPYCTEVSDLLRALRGLSHVLTVNCRDMDYLFIPKGLDRAQSSEFLEISRRSLSPLTIRLLGYDPGPLDNEIAPTHVDKSGITHHLYSSHPGLRVDYGNAEKRIWKDVDIPSGQLAVFSGLQVYSLSRGSARPLVHRVVAQTTESRDSIVTFTPFLGVERIPKDAKMKDIMKKYGF